MSSTEKVLVSPHGYADAEIFFLGGYPLRDDLQNGSALVGSIENTLNNYLRPNGLTIKQCYRSCFIKEKLDYSGTNSAKLKEALAKIDLAYYEKLLYEEIKDINPTVIVPLDDISLGVLHPHIHAIKKPKNRKHWVYCYRGSVLSLRGDWCISLGNQIKVIPIVGPQLLYLDSSARAYTQIDFERISKNRLSRDMPKEGFTWVCRDILSLNNFLDRMWKESPKRVTFDIETYGGLITCISLCFNNTEAISIPIGAWDIPILERTHLWMRVAKVLNSSLEKNNQNIAYDWKILERHGFNLSNVTSDTMLKGALLYPELPKGLDFYTSIYTDIPYYKDEGKNFDPRTQKADVLYIYNAKDALAAHIVAEGQDKELSDDPAAESFYKNEMAPSILIYKNIDQTGLIVDLEIKKKKLDKYNAMFNSNELILQKFVGIPDFNARSPKQVGEVLYEQLKFPPRYKTLDSGIKSWKTDKDTLDDLLLNYSHKTSPIGLNILNRVIVLRKLAKIIEYIETPLYPDNTFRGSYNLAGPVTGRSSCGKTIDERFRNDEDGKSTKATKRLGRSLQTISKHGFSIDDEIFEDFEDTKLAYDIREMFVPPRNHVFIEGDGKGAEARVVFVLAEDYEGLERMDQYPKIHARTAAAVFGIDVNSIVRDIDGDWLPRIPIVGISYYDLGKKMRHAGNYKMGAFRLAQMTHLKIPFCEEALLKFHAIDPNIQSVFHEQIITALKKQRKLTTPFGRSRTFFSPYSDSLEKEAIAYIPQSTISDLTKFSMWRIADQLPGYMTKYKFVVEQHDSILSVVHKDIKDKYLEVFKRVYERPIDFNNCTLSRDYQLVVPAEIFIGESNWMDMKEVKI